MLVLHVDLTVNSPDIIINLHIITEAEETLPVCKDVNIFVL